jgi:hypothetical protein
MAAKGDWRGKGMTRKFVPFLPPGNPQDIKDTARFVERSRTFEARIADVEAVAREILQFAKFDKKGALILTEDEEDSPAHFAERILRLIIAVRAAIKRGDADEAAFFSVTLGGLITEHDMKVDYEKTWAKGVKFDEGPKQPRLDLLARLIDAALVELGRDAKTTKVLGHIKGESAIQDVDPDDSTISWREGPRKNDHVQSVPKPCI